MSVGWACDYLDCPREGRRYTTTEQYQDGTVYQDWNVSCDDHRWDTHSGAGQVVASVPGWDHAIGDEVINQATGQVLER